jgi:hypothetical protein
MLELQFDMHFAFGDSYSNKHFAILAFGDSYSNKHFAINIWGFVFEQAF